MTNEYLTRGEGEIVKQRFGNGRSAVFLEMMESPQRWEIHSEMLLDPIIIVPQPDRGEEARKLAVAVTRQLAKLARLESDARKVRRRLDLIRRERAAKFLATNKKEDATT